MTLHPEPGTHFHVPGDTADVRAVRELVMALVENGEEEPSRWLVRTTDGSLWVLTRSDALPEIEFEGMRPGTAR